MPAYQIYTRTKKPNGQWGDWFNEGIVSARTAKIAVTVTLEKMDSFSTMTVEREGRAELAPEHYQRRQKQYPALTDLSPRKRYCFAEKVNRSNEPGTCLWCGRKLRRKHDAGLGDYADNAFCGLRCGYEFGVTAAALDFRLRPRKDDDAV